MSNNISDEDIPTSPTSNKAFSIAGLQHVSEEFINPSEEDKQEEIPQEDEPQVDIHVIVSNEMFKKNEIPFEVCIICVVTQI